MAVRCEFNNSNFGYRCYIKKQEIPSEVSEKTFQGVHLGNRTNDDVRKLYIENSKVEKIPDKIGEVFKNVTNLWIIKSNLKEISKENLRQFPNLEELNLSGNQLEYLPGDLLGFKKKLKDIWFNDNKIKFIGPELLDGLPNLTYVDLFCNQNINSYYHKDSSSFTLNQLKEEIKSKCKPPLELLNTNESQKTSKLQKVKEETQTSELPFKNFTEDLNKFFALDDFKDFTIKVGSKDFKVHKLVLMARSPFFVDFIKSNPDADEWVLTDIPAEVFEDILEFIYTDQHPKNPRNAREIFAAAGKLKIESLKEFLAEILIKEMENEENLDFLLENFNLGFKFDCKKLKSKAFERIKKQFADGELKNEFLDDPERLKVLIEAKKIIMESVVKKDVGNSAR